MLRFSDVLSNLFWPLIILGAIAIGITIVFGILGIFFGKRSTDFSVYQKRRYLFDSKTEFELFNILNELYGDRFYLFPQVHYSHLIEVNRKIPYRVRFGYRNKIDRKSADLVICDKIQIVPQLVIELDGSSHELEKRKERDEFINHIMDVTGLNILHLKTGNLNREFIRSEIDQALLPK